MPNKTVMVWRWFWGLNWAMIIIVINSMNRVLFVNVLPSSSPTPTYKCTDKDEETKETSKGASDDGT